MGYWLSKFEKAQAETKEAEIPATLDHISNMRFSELERRNIAVQIFSEILGCTVWLCGNNKLADKIRRDSSDAVVYTTAEFRCLIDMNPGPEALKEIHAAKQTFPGSTIVETIHK